MPESRKWKVVVAQVRVFGSKEYSAQRQMTTEERWYKPFRWLDMSRVVWMIEHAAFASTSARQVSQIHQRIEQVICNGKTYSIWRCIATG